MKKILTILLLIQAQLLFAETRPTFVMSSSTPDAHGNATSPSVGQDFSLWRKFRCSALIDSQLIISGNEISYFEKLSSVMASPCPTGYISAETINGLDEGLYNFNYYSIPDTDDFPPAEADYPTYLAEQSQFNVVPARIIVSPSTASSISTEILPTEGQAFRLWDFLPLLGCPGRESTEVNYVGNEINVFILLAPPSTTGLPCPSPLPPVYTPVADIQALEAGDYLIKYYIVPEGNAFPPIVADYPSYFIENRAFSVLQVSNVNSLSTLNLIALCTVFLLMGLFMVRNKI